MEKIRVIMETADHEVVDRAVLTLVNYIKTNDVKIYGPLLLPVQVECYTAIYSFNKATPLNVFFILLLWSSGFQSISFVLLLLVNKKAREKFKIRTHKRAIDILNPTAKTIEILRNFNLPVGVEIKIES